jgi:hypothetical protein
MFDVQMLHRTGARAILKILYRFWLHRHDTERTRHCRFPTPINFRDLGFRRVLTMGNINDDATGFDIKWVL